MENIGKLKIKGIDIDEALRIIDDEDILEAMMKSYCEDGDNKLRLIEEALKNNDLKDYAVHVHALKSSSKAIGAIRLSERFKELELAGKRGDGIYIKGGNGAAIEEYKRILKELRAVFPKEEKTTLTLSEEDVKPLLKAIDNKELEGSLGVLDVLEKRDYSSYVNGSLKDVRMALEIRDFEDARALLEDMLLTIEVSGL